MRRLRRWTSFMLTASEFVSRPNSAPRRASDTTRAEWIRFLLGRHAMFGQDPPSRLRSTIAVRWPALAIVQARYFPASPLPRTRISNCSTSDTGPLRSVEIVWPGFSQDRRGPPRRGSLGHPWEEPIAAASPERLLRGERAVRRHGSRENSARSRNP